MHGGRRAAGGGGGISRVRRGLGMECGSENAARTFFWWYCWFCRTISMLSLMMLLTSSPTKEIFAREKKSSEGTLVSEGYVAMVRAPSNNHCRFASLCRFTLSRASLSSKTTCDRKVKGFRTLGLPPRCLCLPCLLWAKEPGFVPRGSRHAREGPKGPAFCQGSTRARSMRSASRSLGLCLPESILSSKPDFVFRALHFRGNVAEAERPWVDWTV